jgi:dephospho-CoA kinase
MQKTQPSQTPPSLQKLQALVETIHRLRAPNGCPWDRAQTHQSLRQHLIEEAYEVLDVVDQIHTSDDLKKEKVKNAFREELGDLLMQVLLHSEMANEVGAFNVFDVAQTLNEKLIRRHPHVFGDAKADSADHALKNWEKEKAKEKTAPGASCLDGVPKNLPALQKAARVIEKVTKVGFQWDDMNGPLSKVEEEFSELRTEIFKLEEFQKSSAAANPESAAQETALRQRIEAEMGDLLFTLSNVSFLMKVNPEDALRSTLARFEKRFRHVESRIKGLGKTLEQSELAEMDVYWNEAKKLEKVRIVGLTGGIASGKSAAAQLFSELGIPVVNADLIAKEISETDEKAKNAILNRFGTTDRKKLREIIFADPRAKADLENILHPLVHDESIRIFQELAKKNPLIIYEAAILVETGRHRGLDGLIVVEAPKEIRLKRLCERDKVSSTLAEKMIGAQLSDEDRNKHATWILRNDSTTDSLKKQIKEFLSQTGLYK